MDRPLWARWPGLSGGAVCLLAAAVVAGGLLLPDSATAEPKVDFVADLVARTFVRELFDGRTAELAPLIDRRVSFDGEVLADGARDRRLAEVAARAKAAGRPRRLVVLPYATAQAKFGPPPARLQRVGLKGTVVALARLPRGGLIVIVKRVARRWKVVALSD